MISMKYRYEICIYITEITSLINFLYQSVKQIKNRWHDNGIIKLYLLLNNNCIT